MFTIQFILVPNTTYDSSMGRDAIMPCTLVVLMMWSSLLLQICQIMIKLVRLNNQSFHSFQDFFRIFA
ncbi:unnamed protein product [Ilex paraguariensis]|uniref:Uncharacterized protein n=1 Tax=Ilex paraguariensis TaxID=185542 RepID=A0ABC8S6U1_9AQUA